MSDARHFTVDGYRALVERLLDAGYRVRSYDDVDPARADLVLRHDVDMSLGAAVEIAQTEHAVGVRATYFVLFGSECYNPFTPASRDALDRIAECGHAIGLHFDPTCYAVGVSLDDAARNEADALAAFTGARIETMSFHRPSPEHLEGAHRVGGLLNAYAPRFFRDMGYCSDSRGGWHHGHPLDHPVIERRGALQLLTHPIWWTSGAGDTVQQKLDRLVHGRIDRLRSELGRNCEPYDPSAPLGPPPSTPRPDDIR